MTLRTCGVLLSCIAGLALACAGTGSGRQFDFYRQLPDDQAYAGKIEDWQSRERAEKVVLPLDPPTRTAADRSGMLHKKFNAFRHDKRVALAREFAEWSQRQARKHYRFEPLGRGAPDHWPTFRELLERNGDDCDGLDLLAYHLMRDLGFPEDELYRAIVTRDRDGANHMVTLWFEDPEDPWVVDVTGAMTKSLKRLSDTSGFTPIRMFNDRDSFAIVEVRQSTLVRSRPQPGAEQ